MSQTIYKSYRYKVVVLTMSGKILTKEYRGRSSEEASRRATMSLEIDRVLAVEEIHEQPK